MSQQESCDTKPAEELVVVWKVSDYKGYLGDRVALTLDTQEVGGPGMESDFKPDVYSILAKEGRAPTDEEFRALAISKDKVWTKTHEESGWTISAVVESDWYAWVEEFEAVHPVHGKLKGNFSVEVLGTSKEALDHFLKYHPFEEFDYDDI